MKKDKPIMTAVREGYDYMKKDKQIGTTLKNTYQGVMSADLTGACNRCKYTFTEDEKNELETIIGGNVSNPFSISLQFNNNGELELVSDSAE
jgi:hypothetical protein